MQQIRFIFAILLFIFICRDAYSFAWLRDKGEFISIHTFNLQRQQFGEFTKYGIKELHVESIQYQLYAEYGLTDSTTIGSNIISDVSSINGDNNLMGIKMNEFFIRKKILSNKNFILSGQALYKTPPIYDHSILANHTVYGGSSQHDIEARIQMMIKLDRDFNSFSLTEKNRHIVNFELGYRQRFNLPFNEIKIDAQYIFWITFDQALIFSIYKTIMLYNHGINHFSSAFRNIDWKINDRVTFSTTLVSQLDERTYVSIGAYSDIYNSIFGSGEKNFNTFGMSLGLWLI